MSGWGLLTDVSRRNTVGLVPKPATDRPNGLHAAPPRVHAHEEALDPVVVLYGVATAVCAATPLLVALRSPAALRGPVLLAFALLVPGCAITTVVARDRPPELGLVLGSSLAALTLGAQAMLSTGTWIPVAGTYVVAALCFPVLVGAFVRRLGTPLSVDGDPAVLWTNTLHAASSGVRRLRRIDSTLRLHGLILGEVLVLWLAALAQTRVGVVSGIGLVDGLPTTFFLALALLVGGFGWAVADARPRPGLLAIYTVALIVVLHGTTAVLYAEPRYAWTYKHLGVISYLSTHGAANRDVDIYNNWPGFFALNAWFSRVSGWRPISYAAWAQVAFELLNVSAIIFCLRGLTRDARLVWVTCWIFVCVNWLGQDYLSPQAFGFFEAMIVIGLVIRCAPRQWEPATRAGHVWVHVLERMSARLHLAAPDTDRPPAPLGREAALLVGTLCFGAVVVSHQLTPFVLIALVAALVALRRARPVWLPGVMTAMTLGWLWFAWPFVSRHFALFDLGGTATAHPSGAHLYSRLPGVHVVDVSKLILVALLVALALVGFLLSLRTRTRGGFVVALAVTPAAAAIVQSYGGEGWLRALLFALPWLAFLAAGGCLRWREILPTSWFRWLGITLVSTALIVPFLFAYFGQEAMNYMSPDDVAVNRWYDERAPTGSVIAFVGSNAPARLGTRYASLNVGYGETTVTNVDMFPHDVFGDADANHLAEYLQSQRGTGAYLVTSPSQTHYLEYYGIVRRGWVAHFEAALSRSSRFELVYRIGAAAVFKVVPPRFRGPR